MAALAYITLIFTLCANISQQKIEKSSLAKPRTLQHPSQIECAKGKHLEIINEGIAGEESYCAHNISNCATHLKANGECSQCQALYSLTEDTEKTPRTFCSQRLEYWIPIISIGTGVLILQVYATVFWWNCFEPKAKGCAVEISIDQNTDSNELSITIDGLNDTVDTVNVDLNRTDIKSFKDQETHSGSLNDSTNLEVLVSPESS